MKLSDNFWLSEFQRSMTATRLGIDNTIPENLIVRGRHLTQNSIQPLRNIYGKPIRIASGYRTPALNSYIGGSAHSQHTRFEAADIDTVTDNLILWEMILDKGIPFDQLIWEYGDDKPEWIHISLKMQDNRHQKLRAYRDKFGKHYSEFK
jgi:hypothetical protein